MKPRGRRAPAELRVTVNNRRCHRYGICQAEADDIFRLAPDGRLHYDARPHSDQREQARMAARLCPMQAITIEERA